MVIVEPSFVSKRCEITLFSFEGAKLSSRYARTQRLAVPFHETLLNNSLGNCYNVMIPHILAYSSSCSMDRDGTCSESMIQDGCD